MEQPRKNHWRFERRLKNQSGPKPRSSYYFRVKGIFTLFKFYDLFIIFKINLDVTKDGNEQLKAVRHEIIFGSCTLSLILSL